MIDIAKNTVFTTPDRAIWVDLNWHPSPDQLEKFVLFQKLLYEWNHQINLTRLIAGNDYWISQVFDSLWPFQLELAMPQLQRKIIDVGSGCGFPGLALAIALSGAEVTLIEAIKKKKEALESIIKELKLDSRVEIINERVEVTGQNPIFRELFDISMARAVGADPVVAEYLIPLTRIGGKAILFKGQWTKVDLQRLNKSLINLKANIKNVQRINLPENRGIRHIVNLKKNDNCPKKYPRRTGVPKKNPL
tara:strand:+ start:832 stop:1578 length:747 start_codon:yes stop_codon:yes gene_type:complete